MKFARNLRVSLCANCGVERLDAARSKELQCDADQTVVAWRHWPLCTECKHAEVKLTVKLRHHTLHLRRKDCVGQKCVDYVAKRKGSSGVWRRG
jgi:hypothetical protein